MKYLLLFCGNPHDAEAWEVLPEETRAQQETGVGQWFAFGNGENYWSHIHVDDLATAYALAIESEAYWETYGVVVDPATKTRIAVPSRTVEAIPIFWMSAPVAASPSG